MREQTRSDVQEATAQQLREIEAEKKRQFQLMDEERAMLREQEEQARKHIELLTRQVISQHGRALGGGPGTPQMASRATTNLEERARLAQEQGRKLGEISAKTRQLEETRDKIVQRLQLLNGRSSSRSGLVGKATSSIDLLGEQKPSDLRSKLESSLRRDEEIRRRLSADARNLKPHSSGLSSRLSSRTLELGDKYTEALHEMDAIVELGERAMQQHQQQRSSRPSTRHSSVTPQRYSPPPSSQQRRRSSLSAQGRRESRPSSGRSSVSRRNLESRQSTIAERAYQAA